MTNLERLANLKPQETAYFDNVDPGSDDEETMKVERRGDGFYGDCGKYDFTADNAGQADAKLKQWGYTRHVTTQSETASPGFRP